MIKVINVSKTYADSKKKWKVDALKNVSLSVQKGEFISIVGASGSGKSTLLNLLGGLDSPSSGDIIFDDKSIVNLNSDKLAEFRNSKVGFIFQSNYLEPQFTVLKNVCLPLIIQGIPKIERESRARKILKNLGLEAETDRLASKVSGGQMRRICVARAIINNPEIILADEPTANLDRDLALSIIGVLRDIAKTGVSVIMVTHLPEEAKMADKILYIESGELISEN